MFALSKAFNEFNDDLVYYINIKIELLLHWIVIEWNSCHSFLRLSDHLIYELSDSNEIGLTYRSDSIFCHKEKIDENNRSDKYFSLPADGEVEIVFWLHATLKWGWLSLGYKHLARNIIHIYNMIKDDCQLTFTTLLWFSTPANKHLIQLESSPTQSVNVSIFSNIWLGVKAMIDPLPLLYNRLSLASLTSASWMSVRNFGGMGSSSSVMAAVNWPCLMLSSRLSCSMLIRNWPDLLISASFRRNAKSEEDMMMMCSYSDVFWFSIAARVSILSDLHWRTDCQDIISLTQDLTCQIFLKIFFTNGVNKSNRDSSH